jgi:hypothetical protein
VLELNALWTISNQKPKVVPMLWRPMLGEIVKDLSRLPLCRFLALLVLRADIDIISHAAFADADFLDDFRAAP